MSQGPINTSQHGDTEQDWYAVDTDGESAFRITPGLTLGETPTGALALNDPRPGRQWLIFDLSDSREPWVELVTAAMTLGLDGAGQQRRYPLGSGIVLELPNNTLCVNQDIRMPARRGPVLRVAAVDGTTPPRGAPGERTAPEEQASRTDTAEEPVPDGDHRTGPAPESGAQTQGESAPASQRQPPVVDAVANLREQLGMTPPTSGRKTDLERQEPPEGGPSEPLISVMPEPRRQARTARQPQPRAEEPRMVDPRPRRSRPVETRVPDPPSRDDWQPGRRIPDPSQDDWEPERPPPLPRQSRRGGPSDDGPGWLTSVLLGAVALALGAIALILATKPPGELGAPDMQPAAQQPELAPGSTNGAARPPPEQSDPQLRPVTRSPALTAPAGGPADAQEDIGLPAQPGSISGTQSAAHPDTPVAESADDAATTADSTTTAPDGRVPAQDARSVDPAEIDTSADPVADTAGSAPATASVNDENDVTTSSRRAAADDATQAPVAAPADPRLLEARQLLYQGDITTPPGRNAVVLLRRVLQDSPSNAAAQAMLHECSDRLIQAATTYREHGLEYEARNTLEEVFSFDPSHAEARQLWKMWVGSPR